MPIAAPDLHELRRVAKVVPRQTRPEVVLDLKLQADMEPVEPSGTGWQVGRIMVMRCACMSVCGGGGGGGGGFGV